MNNQKLIMKLTKSQMMDAAERLGEVLPSNLRKADLAKRLEALYHLHKNDELLCQVPPNAMEALLAHRSKIKDDSLPESVLDASLLDASSTLIELGLADDTDDDLQLADLVFEMMDAYPPRAEAMHEHDRLTLVCLGLLNVYGLLTGKEMGLRLCEAINCSDVAAGQVAAYRLLISRLHPNEFFSPAVVNECPDDWFFCPDLEDPEQLYHELHGAKKNMAPIRMTLEELMLAGVNGYARETPAMSALRRTITRLGVSEETAEGLLLETILVFQNGQCSTAIFFLKDMLEKLLQKQLTDSTFECLVKQCTELNNTLPLWWNKGHAPEEILLTNAKPSADGTNQHTKKPAVGRNEVCPCGSGKKYKNCCGKFH